MDARLICAGLLAGFCLACTQQETQVPVPGENMFYAKLEQPADPETKVYADRDMRILWHADDRISVFNRNTSNEEYRFTGESGANAGSFTKVTNDGPSGGSGIPGVYAVYPYQASTQISGQGELTVILPTNQAYADHSFGPGANAMVSATTDDELMFKNVGGYLVLKLYGEGASVSSVKLRGNDGERLAGKATVNAPFDGAPVLEMQADASTQEVVLTCPESVALGATADDFKEFWFVLPPTTFSQGFTITVTGPDGAHFEKSTSKSITIGRNRLSRMSPVEVVLEDAQQVHQEEIDFLVKLYDSTGGDSWFDHTHWKSDLPVREWYGVTTDDEGYVLELRLDGNNLCGKLPEGFDKLSHLQYLSMKNNELEDFIPSSLVQAPYFPYIWGDILCGNKISKKTFLSKRVPGPEVSTTDILKGGAITLNHDTYAEYDETYLGQWEHGVIAQEELESNLVSALIRSYKEDGQEKPDQNVILVSNGTAEQIKEDIAYDPEDTEANYRAVSTYDNSPFGGFPFYPISGYPGFGWVTVDSKGIVSDTNLLFDEEEKPTIRYGQEGHLKRLGPDFNYIDLLEEFGAWGTWDGEPLDVIYRCPASWVHIVNGYALVNANDYTIPRVVSVYADLYRNKLPVRRLYFRISQDYVQFQIEVKSNKGDFPYWSRFDTGGNKALFYTPYQETHSFVIRSNTEQIYWRSDIIDNNDPENVTSYATDFDPPTLDSVPADTGGTGYEFNYQIKVTYPANRSIEEDYGGYYDDEILTGLARITRLEFYPYLETVLDWETLETGHVLVKEGTDGDILYDKVYVIQSPVIVALNVDEWHEVCPIAGKNAEISGFCPVFTAPTGGLQYGESISANVDWDWSDLWIDSNDWPFKMNNGKMSGHSDGKVITTNTFDLYAAEQAGINGYQYDPVYGDYLYRPSVTVPSRDTRMFLSVDLKDGGDPVEWPLLHVFQYSIPKITSVEETWNGEWVAIDHPDYNYMTRAYYYFTMDLIGDLNLGNYTKLMFTGTDCLDDEASGTSTYTWHPWEDHTDCISDSFAFVSSLYSYYEGFVGYYDLRIVYPNGVSVYIENGPKKYDVSKLRIEPNPIPFGTNASPDNKNAKQKGIQYPTGGIHPDKAPFVQQGAVPKDRSLQPSADDTTRRILKGIKRIR